MKTRPFGSTGIRVPVLGQGTWNMERDRRRDAVESLQRGLDAGMAHIDTAEMYGRGRVEELVGEAIAGRRGEVFLVSKVLPENASRPGTIEACERSLARLGTDRLDCYLLHWPGEHPLEDTLEAFERLVDAGKIVCWGLSTFDEEELAAAAAIADPDRIACNQVLYHLRERSIEHAVLPYCAENGIALVAYSPFGSGRFPGPRARAGRVLAEIARERSATPHQVALAFLLRHPACFAIPKTSDPDHAAENAGAAELNLDADEIRHIERAFPRGRHPRGVPIL
jgi:diketogulonate reductase-like aldo/keto reductase